MTQFPWITALTASPLIGGLLILAMPSRRKSWARAAGLVFSLIPLLFVGILWTQFDSNSSEIQFVERYQWIPSFGDQTLEQATENPAVHYFVGVDGLGLLMVLLTALVMPMGLSASWTIEERAPIYVGLFLLLQAGLFGVFTALNFFHWFLFWELSLIPAFFLIKIWGGVQRTQAALQFFLYTMAGSVAMLLAFLAIYLATRSMDFLRLAELGRTGELASALSVRLGWYHLSSDRLAAVIFAGLFLGFAVKVPLVPFHSWLPAAYAESPTSTTMVLTAVMSKMGVYGMLRILVPFFPEQMRAMMGPLLWLAVFSIVFSAFAALAQQDLKRMLGYSSINHLGYALLGIFAAVKTTGPEDFWVTEKAAALSGVFLQMFNHGLTAAALFCLVGFLEQRSGGARGLNDFGGLRQIAPIFSGLTGIALFASLGLPGLNAFVGEFLIFKGVFSLAGWAAAFSCIGLLVTAIFLIGFFQQVFYGPLNPRWTGLRDLTWRERAVLLPAMIFIFVLGIYPQLLIGTFNATIQELVAHLS